MRLGLVVPYLALVTLHVVSDWQMEQPIILADELGYLGNARYLAGAADMPNMAQSQFYHFGYSLLLLPAFWLFPEPLAVYEAALLVNALVASSLLFPLYSILQSFFRLESKLASWVAFTCCLYPSLLLYSNYAWSENAFIPCYAATAWLLGKLLQSHSWRDALLFGLSAGFLYAIHPRALPVVVVVLGYLAALGVLNVLPKRKLVTSAATTVLVVAITRAVNAHLKALGWDGAGEFSATKLAGRLVPGSAGGDFEQLVERAMGQLLYLSHASLGLFLVGVVFLGWALLRGLRSGNFAGVLSQPRTSVPLFVAGTGAGIFTAAVTAKLFSIHGPAGLRGADFVHGRYNEAFAVMFIAFALAGLCRSHLPRRAFALTIGAIATVTFAMTVVVASEVADAQRRHYPDASPEELARPIPPTAVSVAAVPGLYPLIGALGGLRLYPIWLAGTAALVLVAGTMRLTRRGGMALLSASFLTFAVYNHRHFVVPANAKARPRLDFVSAIERLGPVDTLSYDAAHHVPSVFFGAQFLLPHTKFTRFDSRRRELPSSELVVTGNKWRQARRLGARFVVSSGWDNALWVLPGSRQSAVSSASYEDVILGIEPVPGFQESGFHLPERYLGAPGRWTDGSASLKVPVDAENPPILLALATIVPGREGAELRVLVNGVELWNGRIPSESWSKLLELQDVPPSDELLVELRSDAFVGKRRLGVMVRGIRLILADGRDSIYEGVTLGASPRVGIEESGFHESGTPGRWTNGHARLRVPVSPNRLPRRLKIDIASTGQDQARLRVLANGVELWSDPIPGQGWSRAFPLDEVPMKDELRIEIESDTFVPAETQAGSADTRHLGVLVTGVRLTGRD